MSSRDTIQNELRRLDSNLPLASNPSFSVPEGYFENLPAAILAKAKNSDASEARTELAKLSPLLAGLSREMPYSVPSLYFEEASQSIPLTNADVESPLLAAIGKAMPYDLPHSYFDNLPKQILESVTKEQKGKVVPLFHRTWMRVAAAAVIFIGLVIGGLQIFNGKGPDKEFAKNNTDTTSTLVAQAAPIQQEMKKVSTKDLEEFAQTVPATVSASPKKEAVKKEASDLLKDVSVSDMENFLSAVPLTDDDLAATDEP